MRGGRNIASSANVRGRPRHVWAEDERWDLGNYEAEQREIGLNVRNQGGVGRILFQPASVSFRDMSGRKTEDGRWEITQKIRQNGIKCRSQGGVG